MRRGRALSYALLPAVLVAAFVLAYYTFRTTFQLDKLRQQSVLEATLALANEKADRLDKRIITEDNTVFAIADPAEVSSLTQRWVPTAQRETPTVRAILVLDDSRDVVAFASRVGGALSEEEQFRRLLLRRLLSDMDLASQPDNELRHLHREYDQTSYLVSYWQRPFAGHRYVIVAWHDIARIVKDTLPELFGEGSPAPSRLNVVDEQGRIVYGPPLRSGEFTVGVKFPTTLYNWHLQVSPAGAEEIAHSVQSRKTLELVFVTLSLVVIVTGVLTILFAVERERRLNALKTDFVANVSHELKTPLALVRMFGELLQSGRVANDDKRKEYLDIIVNESERLSNLIENVLDFARVERGRSAYEFQPMTGEEVAAIVQRATQVLRYRAEREHVKLEVDVAEGLPPCLVDERALQLAIINLVDNAIKYGCAGAPEQASGTVRIRVSAERGSLSIAVSDDGPGISASEHDRIFERFVRGRATRDGKDGTPVRGSGIGLALVKHIAESHGGAARVDSDPSQRRGSTFTVYIPSRPLDIDGNPAHDIV